MDPYSYTSKTDSSTSASYSSSSNSSTPLHHQHQQEKKSERPPPAFRSTLHSVHKYPKKSIITKKPIAPLPPTTPKIYKVDPIEFKDVVQKLTGAPEFQPTRLQEVAPPPLSLSPPQRPLEARLMAEEYEEKPWRSFDSTFGALSPVGFSLSPSSLAWCSAMLLSPGALASFEPSAVV